MDETYDANVRIRDLSRRADAVISGLAAVRNCNKWEVIKDAIEEYADRHRHELVTATEKPA